MKRHNQTIFLIEQLQPSWLGSRSWIWAYLLTSRIIIFLMGGLIIGLIYSVAAARLLRITDTLIPGLGGWLVFGLMFGLVTGLLVALTDGIRYPQDGENVTIKAVPTPRQLGLNVVGYGLVSGVGAGLVTGLFANMWLGLIQGLAFGGSFGLFQLHESRRSLSREVFTVEALDWSWQRGVKIVPVGLAVGFVGGLIMNWIGAQNQVVLDSLPRGPIGELLSEQLLLLVLGGGLFFSLYSGVVFALFGGLDSQLIETKIRPNEGMRLTLRNALLVGPGFGLILMVAGWLLSVPLMGFQNGLDFSVVFGIGTGTVAFLWYGGAAIVVHYTLRIVLWFQGRIPLDTAHFLDYAAERVFLQKVGGGYIFIHRLLLEHFAAMDVKEQADD